MDYFGSTMLQQTIQKAMWPFTLQGLLQYCNISLLPQISLSNNTDQIVKEYSFSLLFQNLFSAYVFILLSGMSTTTCNGAYKYTLLTMNRSGSAKHILN